jgi:transketolase
VITDLIGGSADLTHSNLTHTKATRSITPTDFSGRYLHYGVREHGMAAIMNGLSLHGGFIPYGGTFLIFANYLWPALRMSAMMGQRVLYVLTHDSIGLGEDGPTHQPIETLAALRATPGVLVFRPADAIETMEAYEVALSGESGPAVFALSRQNLPTVRQAGTENLTAKGAYVLAEAEGGARRVTLIATGSEVAMALAARDMLAQAGVPAAVVSMPSWELFERQPKEYRDAVLGDGTVRVAVEALSTFGWDRWVGPNGTVIGMTGFGASAPADRLYDHFGITARAVADAALARL